jgi:hypothetical protein
LTSLRTNWGMGTLRGIDTNYYELVQSINALVYILVCLLKIIEKNGQLVQI